MTEKQSPAAQYDQVVKAIVTAVPEIVAPHFLDPHEDVPLFQQFNAKDVKLYRPIRLADVLLALQPIILKVEAEFSSDGFAFHSIGGHADWNLRQDSLDQQSPETIAFLHSLLVHE